MLKLQAPPSAVFSPRRFTLADGVVITLRAIRPEDADIEQAFVRSLSPRSKRMRFFANLMELSPKLLYKFTHPQYPDNWALIATIDTGEGEREIGVARYITTGGDAVAEFAVTVADEWQGRGIATHLLRELIAVAAKAGLRRLEGVVLRENYSMRRLAQRMGFSIKSGVGDDPTTLRLVKALSPPRE